MAPSDNREQTLLDQYWDANETNRHYIPSELDASLRETVDRFHESDDAPTPDRAFIDRLWGDLAGDISDGKATSPPAWTEHPDDEPTEPQFIPGREENNMQTRQQSAWRRRSRQLGELVAGVLALALITGGLVLAYQNLIGEGEGNIPGAGDDLDGLVPSLSPAGAIPWDGDILQRYGIGSVEIGRFDDHDYAFLFTVPGTQAGIDSGPELRTVRLDQAEQHEQVGSVELDIPWTSSIGVAMGKMALVDDVLYLPVPADERPGIWAVDVSDPANPTEAAFVDIDAGYPTTIAASNIGMLAVATFDGPMYFVDVSDADEPNIISAWDAEFLGYYDTVQAPSIAFQHDHLFIARHDGLSIIDVSEPADLGTVTIIENPAFDWDEFRREESDLLGPFPADAWHDVAVVDDLVHIAGGDAGILLYDISDLSSPVEAGRIDLAGRTVRLGVSGDHPLALSVTSNDEELQPGEQLDWTWSIDVLDVSNPDEPEIIDRLPDLSDGSDDADFLAVNTRHLIAGDDYVLTFGHSGSLVAHIDWVEPGDDGITEVAPTPAPPDEDTGDLVPRLSPFGVFGQQGDVLQGAELGSVQIARIEDQTYAFLLIFPMSEGGDEVSPTIQVLQLAPDGQPETVGTLALDAPWSGPMQFNMGQMALVDGVLYVPMPLQDQPGIWIVDVSDPEVPAELGFLDIEADWPMTLVADGDVAVATGMFGNIYFFLDISDPAERVVAGQLESSELELHAAVEVPALTMDGENLYIAHPRGLTILDVSDPSNPEGLGAIENPDWEGPGGVAGAGTDTQIGISDEDSMLDRMVDPDAYHDVAVVGDHAYVAAGDAGVLVIDVSDPSDPQAVEPVELPTRTFRLTESNGFLYALGVSSEGDDEQQQPVWAWSIDTLELDDLDEPRIVSQLENLIPSDAGRDTASFFLMSTVRQAVTGQDFSFAWGRAGAYLAAIDWVEPSDDAVEETSVSRPDEPAIDTDNVSVYFPRQAEQPGIDYDDVPAPGELVLDESDCLRLDEDGAVIIWPHTGFSVELIESAVTIVDEEGEAIASVGEGISLHGSPIPGSALESDMMHEPLPDACADAEEYRLTGPGIGGQ